MTTAFIITAVVAGIMFFLWISGQDRLQEAEDNLLQLNKYIQEMQVNSGKIVRARQTRLTMEMIPDVIRDNGFVPHQEDPGWITFKKQGEVYVLGVGMLPNIQFCKGYRFDNEYDLDVLQQSALMAMDELGFGRILVSVDDKRFSYNVFGVEMTVEHFSESFTVYMRMLDDMMDCHFHFYHKLMEDKRTAKLDATPVPTPNKTIVS